MSYEHPTTDDEAQEFDVLPDWGQGIQLSLSYQTDIKRSRRGIEQRSQRRRRPRMAMDYTPAQIMGADALLRLETLRTRSRGRLLVPWWPSAQKLSTAMASDTSVTLQGGLITGEWEETNQIYLWHRSLGGQFRTVTEISGSTFTLENIELDHQYPADGYAFPVMVCLLQRGDNLLRDLQYRTASGQLTFRTL